MYISRLVIKNFRNLPAVDVQLHKGMNSLVGENNSGKSNLLFALQLVLDANVPAYQRKLQREDFARGIDLSSPTQILVGVEIEDFDASKDLSKVKEQALVHEWQVSSNKAVLCFRFRPMDVVRQKLQNKEIESGKLKIDDYDWELVGGCPLDSNEKPVDLKDVTWDNNFQVAVKFQMLSAFKVGLLPALRDVEQDFRSRSSSPLQKLIEIIEVSEERREALVEMLKNVNDEIAAQSEIANIAQEIDKSFESTVGKVFHQKLGIAISEPTFMGLTRSLRVLFSEDGVTNSDLVRNGLGLNNTIYMSILLRCFDLQRISEKVAGHLLLIEEPEAHLHPQLQQILVSNFLNKDCQVVATTHSTHVSAKTPANNLIIFTCGKNAQTTVVSSGKLGLNERELKDLERYLDATKSVLLFAKKVILVEGMTEVFLLPALIKKFRNLSLEELGISVVPIHGTHFESFVKLFGPDKIRKKCAVVTDGDLRPSDGEESEIARLTELRKLESPFVKVFTCPETFEKELAARENLKIFISAASYFNRKGYQQSFENWHSRSSKLDEAEIAEFQNKALAIAKSVGKARFAQVAATYIEDCNKLPTYIGDSVDWLLDDTVSN